MNPRTPKKAFLGVLRVLGALARRAVRSVWERNGENQVGSAQSGHCWAESVRAAGYPWAIRMGELKTQVGVDLGEGQSGDESPSLSS